MRARMSLLVRTVLPGRACVQLFCKFCHSPGGIFLNILWMGGLSSRSANPSQQQKGGDLTRSMAKFPVRMSSGLCDRTFINRAVSRTDQHLRIPPPAIMIRRVILPVAVQHFWINGNDFIEMTRVRESDHIRRCITGTRSSYIILRWKLA